VVTIRIKNDVITVFHLTIDSSSQEGTVS